MDYEEELRTLTGLSESSPAGAVDTDGNPVTDNTELGDVDAEATTVGALRDAMFSGLPKWATMKSLAPDFSAEATYTVGTYVNYNYKIWECTTAVETAGDWTGTTNWTERTIAQMLGGMSSKVDTVNTNVATLLARQAEIVVTCVTQDDVTVTGQTVTLRAGSSAQAEVYDTRAYNGQPVTFSVPKDFRYFVEVSSTLSGHFNPTTATGTATANTTNVTLTYSDTSHITAYADVKSVMDSITSQAEGRTALVGIQIEDTWIDEQGDSYSDPMIVYDVQPILDPSGAEHLAAIMMRRYAASNLIQFDAAECGIEAYATEATAQNFIYYWGYGKKYDSTKTYAVNNWVSYNGGIFKCTTAVSSAEAFDISKWSLLDAVFYNNTKTYAVGEYVKYGGKAYQCTTAVETVEDFDATKWEQKLGTSTFQPDALANVSYSTGATIDYTAYGAIYHTDISSSNKSYFAYGYNNWELSAVRQYLNSNEAIGLWWHIQHTGDCPPSQLSTVRGYMAGCSPALLQYAKPIKVPVQAWNKQPEYTIDLFWLPSGTEYYGVVNTNEGNAFKKIKDDCYSASGWTSASNSGTAGRRKYLLSARSTTANIWMRSPRMNNSDHSWGCGTGAGYMDYDGSNGGGGFCSSTHHTCPCCAIY